MALKDRVISYSKLGIRVREARESADLSQLDAATMADMKSTHWSHIETNNTHASLQAVIAIANVLNVSVDSLVIDSLENPKQVERVYDEKISELFKDCSPEEAEAIYSSALATKKAIRSIIAKHTETY